MRALLPILLLVGCPRRDPSIGAPDGEVRETAVSEKNGLPRVRLLTDIATHHGKRVLVEGTYEVDPIVRGKGKNLAWIVLDDGTRISRAYSAVTEELGYIGLRVEVTGTITSGPPDAKLQALMAPHIAVEEISLPNGQKAAAVATVPAPPVMSASPPLGARIDRWVQVVGTLTTAKVDATILLADGSSVRVEGIHGASWMPHLGTTVTVTGRLAMERGTGAFGLELVIRGPTAICAGVVNRCGM